MVEPDAEAPQKAKRNRDPVGDGLRLIGPETKKFIQLVLSRVTYGQFLGLDPPLKADLFARLQAVAMLDEFFSLPELDVRMKLGVSEGFLDTLRAHPHYQRVRDALAAGAREIAGVESLMELAEKVEPRVAHELYLMGLNSKGDRERLLALTSLADRTSPKKSRRGDGPRNMTVPPGLLETIQLALLSAPPVATDASVDAARLNVPRQLPSVPAVVDVAVDAEFVEVAPQESG